MRSFLFSMPPLFAWPLAVASGTFLVLTAVLVFLDTPLNGLVFFFLLVVPVGVTPLIARKKRRNIWQWTLATVGLATVQLVIPYVPSVPLPVLLLHPIIPALVLVYERATPPTTPTSNDSETPAGDSPGAARMNEVTFVDMPPQQSTSQERRRSRRPRPRRRRPPR